MAAQGSLYTSHYCKRQVTSVEKGLVIISEVCVCVLTVQRANIRNSWGIISQEICAVDCAKGKLLNCVLL